MFKNILIIGFGMIGSSIARSVIKKYKNVNIFAFDKSNNLKIRINKSKLNNVKVLLICGYQQLISCFSTYILMRQYKITFLRNMSCHNDF